MKAVSGIFLLSLLMFINCDIQPSFDFTPPSYTYQQPKATSIPVVTTAAATLITSSTATLGGDVTSDGGDWFPLRGVVWSTNPAPTVSLSTKTIDGFGFGSFASELTELTASTKYFARAYCTNALGTGYGIEVSFTTLP